MVACILRTKHDITCVVQYFQHTMETLCVNSVLFCSDIDKENKPYPVKELVILLVKYKIIN
jgi:hypothetical protein